MKITQLLLPLHWASALINGDLTGYDADDLEAIRRFTNDMVRDFGQCWCLGVDDEDSGFVKYHDADGYGVLACDCSFYTFDISKRY